jgi:hypothetical protein
MATTNGDAADVPLTDRRRVHFDDADAKVASRTNSTSAHNTSPKQSIILSSTIEAADECCASLIDMCTNNSVILLFMGVNIIVFAYALLFFANPDNVYLCSDR